VEWVEKLLNPKEIIKEILETHTLSLFFDKLTINPSNYNIFIIIVIIQLKR
jgi:hypothetical protein